MNGSRTGLNWIAVDLRAMITNEISYKNEVLR